jgi:plastocyanin
VLGYAAAIPASRQAAPAAPTPESAPTAEVVIELFQFRPGRLTVPVGSRVQWTNRDDVLHTVTSGTPGRPTGLFHGELQGKGATFVVRADRPGTIPYFCARHDHMRGELVVQP